MVSLHQSGQYWKIIYKDDLFTVFSGHSFFWGNEKKYFTHIPGLCKSLRFKRKKMLLLNCFAIVKHIKSLISKNVASLCGKHFMSIFGHIFYFSLLFNTLPFNFIIQFSTYHTFALVLKDRTSWVIRPHWVQITFGENNQLKITVSTLSYFLPTS